MVLAKFLNPSLPKNKHSIWTHSNFIILFISSTILAFGNKIYALTLPLTLYDLTRSSVAMSTMRGIEFLPNLFLALFIGVLVDRVNKKKWILSMISLQIVILLTLYLFTAHHFISLVLYYVCGFFLMAFGYGYSNAQAGLVKQALPVTLLTSANATLNFIVTLVGIMGPTITGVILMLANVYDGLLFTAAAFILSFIAVMFLHSDKSNLGPQTQKRSPFMEELKQGWMELRRNRELWRMTIMVIFFNSTSGMVDTTVVFYAMDDLHLTDALLGLVFSLAGLGGLIASLLVSKVRKRYSNGVLITVNTLLIGVCYLTIFVFNSTLGLSFGLFGEGCFSLMASICIWSYRQESTPQNMIGRVTGLTGSIFKLGIPFAIFATGWLIKWFHPNLIFLIAFLMNVIIFFVCRFSPFWDQSKPEIAKPL